MASFIREEKVDLSKYLPAFLTKDPEFAAKLAAESAVHDEIRQELDDILNQFFVATATWGLTYWEDFLDLPHDETLTDADRRSRIIQKINGSQTVTLDFMRTLINQYITSGDGDVEEKNSEYAMKFDIPLGNVTDSDALYSAIDTYIPAHLGKILELIDKIEQALFCESAEFDKENLVESLTYSGEGMASYYIGIIGEQYFGDKIVHGAEFSENMNLTLNHVAISIEFDREVLTSGD